MKKVHFEVLSRTRARAFKCDLPWAAISISTEVGDFPELSEGNRVDLLRLRFWDVPNPREITENVFSTEQAESIIRFADRVWNDIEVMLVHCEAGMSRSPACAAALEHIYHGPGSEASYFSKYYPNNHVFKTLMEVHYGEGIGEQIARKFLSEKVYDDPWDCTQ